MARKKIIYRCKVCDKEITLADKILGDGMCIRCLVNFKTDNGDYDEHICPLCGKKQNHIGDTWVCRRCNKDAFDDLLWCIRWKRRN